MNVPVFLGALVLVCTIVIATLVQTHKRLVATHTSWVCARVGLLGYAVGVILWPDLLALGALAVAVLVNIATDHLVRDRGTHRDMVGKPTLAAACNTIASGMLMWCAADVVARASSAPVLLHAFVYSGIVPCMRRPFDAR